MMFIPFFFQIAMAVSSGQIAMAVSASDLHQETNWQFLDKVYGEQNLCEAFPNGEIVIFENENCLGVCTRWLYRSEIKCNSENAEINFLKEKDNSHFSKWTITHDEWQQANGNPMRVHRAAVESYGSIFLLDEVGQDSAGYYEAKYSVQSRGPTGNLKEIERGRWLISSEVDRPAYMRTILKERTRKNFFKEKISDRLLAD